MDYGSTAVSTGGPDESGASSMRLNNSGAAEDDVNPPPTRQQKLIKAGLLIALILMIGYVILDYTVRIYRTCMEWYDHRRRTAVPQDVVCV